MPRPRVLDDAKRREVCALVSAGCDIAHAARYVGTSAVTVRREALRNPEFYKQLRDAELSAQVVPLQALKKAAQTHWRAAAWYLERKHPDEFGRRNVERYTVQQVEALLCEFYEAIFAEIDDPEVVDHVNDKVGDFLAHHRMETRAVLMPRPDVHSRRKQQNKEEPVSPTTNAQEFDSASQKLPQPSPAGFTIAERPSNNDRIH